MLVVHSWLDILTWSEMAQCHVLSDQGALGGARAVDLHSTERSNKFTRKITRKLSHVNQTKFMKCVSG